MIGTRDRTAQPISAAMAFAFAVVVAFAVDASPASAQSGSNAQADQSRTLRAPSRTAMPPSGRYVSDAGDQFVLDRSGSRPLLRFDGRDETWVLRPSAAPRGDVIFRNDAGDQVLRATAGGGVTVYSRRSPTGSPASMTGSASPLTPPTLGPTQLAVLMVRRSAMVSQAMGRLVEVNVDTSMDAESLTVEALIVVTDSVIRMARSATARPHLTQLRRITIVEGERSGVGYGGGELRIIVAPTQGAAGRPSSARVIRAVLSQD